MRCALDAIQNWNGESLTQFFEFRGITRVGKGRGAEYANSSRTHSQIETLARLILFSSTARLSFLVAPLKRVLDILVSEVGWAASTIGPPSGRNPRLTLSPRVNYRLISRVMRPASDSILLLCT
jgi:hypothetical protein